MPLSALVPIDPLLLPPDALNTTTSPPIVSRFPAASFARSRNVTMAPDAIVSVDVVKTDVTGEIAPGMTATVGSGVVTGLPPIVAPMVV